MAFYDVLKNLKGYIVIEIEGFFIERFINLTLNDKINIWDIKQLMPGLIEAKIYAKDFKKIKNLVKKAKCKVRIKTKYGAPFMAHRYRHRKIFAILIAVVATTITILNMYVWQVDIVGDFRLPIENIKEELCEENVSAGVMKRKIDTEKVKLNMMIKEPRITWMNVSLKGTKVVVEIVEKDDEDLENIKTEPGNIVADKDGVVSKIYVANGMAKVNKGDTITKNQILISGEMSSEHAETRLVPADGEILIKTWYVEKYKMPYVKQVVSKSGKQEKGYIIKIFNYKINLSNNDTNFEKYDTIVSDNKLKIFGMFECPIEVICETKEEVIVDLISYTKEQAENLVLAAVRREVQKKIPSGAVKLDEKIYTKSNENEIEVEIIIECEEKVGKFMRIGG